MTHPSRITRWRQWLGVALRERRRWERTLAQGGETSLALCNRGERLTRAPQGPGWRCEWQWTSDLHAARVVPRLGRELLDVCIAEHAIGAAPAPAAGQPQVSFIIGHRGDARAALLLATLESIAAQRGAIVECIVVEQETEPRAAAWLPRWVRHVHTPPPTGDMPYCRSWALNVGARLARSPVLVLHDNDMLVPQDYAARIAHHVAEGSELVNLKRFVFYLSQSHTRDVLRDRAALTRAAPVAVTQNLEAGGSIAITARAFERIGGMDESFVGWGGEDNEFWERAQELKVWPYGYLPIVHLWHPAQPRKQDPANPMLAHYRALSAVPVRERIARLRGLAWGSSAGPAGDSEGAS